MIILYNISKEIKDKFTKLCKDKFYISNNYLAKVKTDDISDLNNFYKSICNLIRNKFTSDNNKVKSIRLINYELKDKNYLYFVIDNNNFLAYYILYNYIKDIDIRKDINQDEIKELLDKFKSKIPNVFYIEFEDGDKYVCSFNILNDDNSNKKILYINDDYLYKVVGKDYIVIDDFKELIKYNYLYYSIMEYLKSKLDKKYIEYIRLEKYEINLDNYSIRFIFNFGNKYFGIKLIISIEYSYDQTFYVNVEYVNDNEDMIDLEINDDTNEISLKNNDYSRIKEITELEDKLNEITEIYEENHDIINKIYFKICNNNEKNMFKLFKYELNKYTTGYIIGSNLLKSSLNNYIFEVDYGFDTNEGWKQYEMSDLHR